MELTKVIQADEQKDEVNLTSSVTVVPGIIHVTGGTEVPQLATVNLSAAKLTYNGQEQTVTVTSVVDSKGNTVDNTDGKAYEVSGSLTGKDVGVYTVTATAKADGDYAGTKTANWEITPAPLTAASKANISLYTAASDGIAVDTDLITVNGLFNSDTAEITNCTVANSGIARYDAGSKKLTPVAAGNTSITLTVGSTDNYGTTTVTIPVNVSQYNPIPENKITFTANTNLTYSDSLTVGGLVNAATVESGDWGSSGNWKYTIGGTEVALTDTLASKGINAGSVSVTATYTAGQYQGSKTVTADVAKASIVPSVTWPSGTYTYTGNPQTITPTSTDNGDKIDYAYANNTQTNAGTYSVTVTPTVKDAYKANYQLSGTVNAYSWVIGKAPAHNLTDEASIRFNDTVEREITAASILSMYPSYGAVKITNIAVSGDDVQAVGTASETSAKYQLKSGLSEPPKDTPRTATVTVTFNSTNYEESTLTRTIHVTSKEPVDSSSLEFANAERTYTGQEQTLETAVYKGPTGSGGKIDYTYSPANPKDVGTYTVTATYSDDQYICTKTATLTITPAPLTVTGATVTPKDYDGTTDAAITAVEFSGLMPGDTLTGSDYTVTDAKFASADAAENIPVTFKIELNASVKNYTLGADTPIEVTGKATGTIRQKSVAPTVTLSANSFTFNNSEQKPTVTVTFTDGNGTEVTILPKDYEVTYAGDCVNATNAGAKPTVTVTAKGGNYTFTAVTKEYTIVKAPAPTFDAINKVYKFDSTEEGSAALPEMSNAGTVVYAVTEGFADANGILESAPTVNGGALTYKLAGKADMPADGAGTVTIPVKITSDNYEDATVNVVITLTNKAIPVVSAENIVKTYDGQELTADDIRGSATVDGEPVDGVWSWVTATANMVNAAPTIPYTATVRFTPTDAEAAVAVEERITVTINKATPTVAVSCVPITESGRTLADAALTYTGEPAGTVAWNDPETAEVAANTAYGWTFTPTDTTNYETVTGTLIPYEHVAPPPVVETPTTAAPTASPASGSYPGEVSVTLSAEAGATIYYTTDGTTPSTGSSVYTGPITIAPPATLKAVAVAPGKTMSSVMTEVYSLSAATAAPTASPAGGSYFGLVPVTLSAEAGATIYYTTDGTTPSTGSSVYTGPITIAPPATLKAVAVAPGKAMSGVMTAVYTLDSTYYPDVPGLGGGGTGTGTDSGTGTNDDTGSQPVATTATDAEGNVTTTTKYPDGRVTTVQERADGSVITTNVDSEGNSTSTTRNPDGSTLITVENRDGSSSIVSTSASGVTTAVVDLPASAVSSSNASGTPASLPMGDVTATRDTAVAPTVTVTTANHLPVTVEIPVSNVSSGTIAMLMRADGTMAIIKNTVPTSNGIAVTLNSGDSVKIVDNSKTFADTVGHWGSDAVNFVAARELFNGTGDGRFSPNDNMTRAMLMTVLARYENVDTTGGTTWYEKGVAWAVAQGLSDGTDPNGQITREQLATIIYRYARSKDVRLTAGGNLSRFTDVNRVSSWAEEAMRWCVAEGIINGVDGTKLDPRGNATRAQVATILMRFMEKFPG